ncbi:MAG: hypothetical protein L3J06_10105 [Cyclobacteriaceae bacterium]|nr:hypothetical protein [Cyclobacteriaceae bacterium]
MKIKSLLFLGITAVFFSCKSPSSENKEAVTEVVASEVIAAIDTVSANYLLLKNQCLICHGGGVSHDAIIAPPMQAVKWFYSQRFSTKEKFVEKMVAWGVNPTEEKSLMKGAVKRFKIMPKPATNESDLKTIAEFIYDNELQTPDWFAEHFKKMNGKGKKMNVKNKN